MSSRDEVELEQLRAALEEVRTSQKRMADVTRSLEQISGLLEVMLQTGPVSAEDATNTYRHNNGKEVTAVEDKDKEQRLHWLYSSNITDSTG